MAPMPIYGKNLYKSSSPELNKPWGLILAQIIGDGSTKIAKMMVLCWSLTFLGQVQICFLMHLYGPYTFIWEKCWEFIFWKFPLKTMIQLSWNLIRSIGLPSRHKIAKTEPIENPRWPPQPPFWKSVFDTLPKPLVSLRRNLLCSNRTTSGSKWAKIMLIRNPSWPPQPPSWKSVLDILQTTSELSWNLECCNWFTYRWKIAKIKWIGNPNWSP